MSNAWRDAASGRVIGQPAAGAAVPATTGAVTPAAEPGNQLMDASNRLGLALADEQVSKLLAYMDLLLRWNRVYNLTALRDPSEVLSHHLVDCLAVVPAMRRHAAGRPLRVLDVGSGGGLPGVVLAMLQPDWQVTCVDTVAKKAAFIRQLAGELRVPNLHAMHTRVEAMAIDGQRSGPRAGRGPFDLITSRAFGSLSDFVALTQDLLAPQGVWAAMKGKPTSEELAAVQPAVDMFHVEPIQVPGLDAHRCLVWMRPRSSD